MTMQVSHNNTNLEDIPHLSQKAIATLADFEYRLLELFPDEISLLILYGSYARGDASPESDLDVMVVVKWNEERLSDGTYVAPISDQRWQSIINAATDLLLISELEVSPFVVSEQRFQEGFPLANRVKREGLVLWPSLN